VLNLANSGRLDHGITMIEALVAMTLLLIAGGMVTRSVLDGLLGSEQASSTQQATQQAVAVFEILGNDMRTLSLREQDPLVRGYDLVQLRDVVLAGRGLNDLRIAEPRRLAFVADVVGPETLGAGRGVGPDCVMYSLDTNGALLRRVFPFNNATPGCDGTPLVTQTLLPGAPAAMPTQPALFSYQRRVNSRPLADPINPSDCTALPRDTGTISSTLERGHIVAVNLDLRSFVTRTGQVGESSLASTVAIRTRLAHDYQFALGCSY
jgi:type II secretory pathway pseudopilin PulG